MYRVQQILSPLSAVAVIVFLTISFRRTDAALPWWLIAAWGVFILADAYVSLFRVAYRVEAEGGMLQWRALSRSGEVPISDVIELRPSRFGGKLEIVTSSEGRVSVPVEKGVDEFVEALVAQNRSIQVRYRRRNRMSWDMPWSRSRFRSE